MTTPSAEAMERARALRNEIGTCFSGGGDICESDDVCECLDILAIALDAFAAAARADQKDRDAKIADGCKQHIQDIINKGKGTHGHPGYVRDAVWDSWQGQQIMAEHIATAIRSQQP